MIDDLERAGVDLAVRYVPERSVAGGRLLFGETVFPVCSPALANNPANPLVTPDDLHHHVLLYLEHPRAAWLDWELWFHALGLRDFEPAGKLHFSHYDQLIQAAVDGHGVALGRNPLLVGCCASASSSRRSRTRSRPRAPTTSSSRRPRRRKPQVREFADWLVEETHAETLRRRPARPLDDRALRARRA